MHENRTLAALATLLAGLASTPHVNAQTRELDPLPSDRAHGAATIDREQLEQWLTTLTSEQFGGRGTGQPGFALATDMFEEHFRALGLEPLHEQSYRIRVPWVRIEPSPKETWLAIRSADEVLVRVTVQDGLCATATTDVAFAGQLVILRLDDSVASLALDDLQDGDAVLVVATEPQLTRRDYDRLSSRVRRAGGRLYAVANAALAEALPTRGASTPASGNRAAISRSRLPRRLLVTDPIRDRVLAAAGWSIDRILAAPDPIIRVEKLELACQTRVRTTPAPAWNVGAILRGSDPELRDEFVVIGCHLDHLGRRGGTIHPGADDDGSGSAAILALAHAFANNGGAPRRSILFVAFCGEEKGLIGSSHFAKNCPIPLASIVTELQLDMIGRSEENPRTKETADQNRNVLHLIGTEKLSAELHELCLRLNVTRAGFDLERDEEGVFYRSDHWNFAKYGVPVAFFFTGFHRDYHRPTDTVDKIEFDKLERVVRYVYDIAFELAQSTERPRVDQDRWNKLEKKGRREPVAPVRGG